MMRMGRSIELSNWRRAFEAGGSRSEVFDFAEEAFSDIAVATEELAEGWALLPVAHRLYFDPSVTFRERPAQAVAGAVSRHRLRARIPAEATRRSTETGSGGQPGSASRR